MVLQLGIADIVDLTDIELVSNVAFVVLQSQTIGPHSVFARADVAWYRVLYDSCLINIMPPVCNSCMKSEVASNK